MNHLTVNLCPSEGASAHEAANAPKRIIIASRQSRLALWQSNTVRDRLLALYPHTQVEILGLSTRGDEILDRPLAKVGGKGLFTKELEVALLDGRADLAVHSLKDVPMALPDKLKLAAILPRENAADAFISNRYAHPDQLPPGAIVGTSSLRRAALLSANYPHCVIKNLRGNVDTRLRKLDEGMYDAIILAAVGLERLGLQNRIQSVFSPEAWLPSPGQGALAIEVSAHVNSAYVTALHDPNTAYCIAAERAFSCALGGSCRTPLGAYAVLKDNRLTLQGFVATPNHINNADSAHCAHFFSGTLSEDFTGEVSIEQAQSLGQNLALQLLEDGRAAGIDIRKECAAANEIGDGDKAVSRQCPH